MKRIGYGVMIIFLLLSGLVLAKEKSVQERQPSSVMNNGSEFLLNETGQETSPANREQIILFFDDFETDSISALWETDEGWELTETEYWSPTHSFNSPNDASTSNNSFNLVSPVYLIPEIGAEDILRFGFNLYAHLPDSDGDGDNFLEDYYNVSVADINAIPWHATDFNGYDGMSYWCGSEDIDGYADAWVQFFDSPEITIPSGGFELKTMMKWGIEDPAGATVAGTCTDGWDAANVRISTDGGSTWELLTGSSPYDFEYGYGWIYNDGDYDCGGPSDHLASGWGGIQDWHPENFSLNSYAGETVIVRFAFGSDPAYSTIDDDLLVGFFIDDISIEDSSGDVIFSDNADGDPSFTATGGMPWVEMFYDYGDDTRPGGLGWEEYMPGYPFNGNIFLDISDYAGKETIFRFHVRYDDNDDGGQGGGLHIDDFKIYLESTVAYAPPTGLAGEGMNMQVDLMWNDMNASGTEDFVYDNDAWTDYSIYMNSGVGLAGETFELVGPSTINSVQIFNSPQNTLPVRTTLAAYGTLGSMYDTDPTFEMEVDLTESGWNTVDLSASDWSFNGKFIIAYEFSDVINAELDVSAVPSMHSMFKSSTGGWETWAESIAGAELSDGEWGIRANITFNGADVTYNVYRDEEMISGGLTANNYSDFDVENNITYLYAVSATYSDGNESDPSESVEVTPQSASVYELGYDDGTSEMGFNAGQNNYIAVRFSPTGNDPLIRIKWFQVGAGGAFYLKMYDDDNGVPGSEIYTSIITGSVDGWNTQDMSDEEMVMGGTFWVGVREFSSTRPFGLDLDSDSGNSYFRIGAGGTWEPMANAGVAGNLMIRVNLDNPGGGGDVTLDISHNDDWNLIGLPLSVSDASYDVLFADAIEGTLYEFDNGYVQSQVLEHGTGYWLRFDGAGSDAVTGGEISNLTLSLNADWNMISGITDVVDVSSIVDPGGIIVEGTVFGFSNGYSQVTAIEPGNAYWLRTYEAGDISLSSTRNDEDISLSDGSRLFSMEDEVGFVLQLDATVPSGGSYSVHFGFLQSATDDFDAGSCTISASSDYGPCISGGGTWFGDQYAPPAPPPPAFDVALTWGGGERYYSQLLEGSESNGGVLHEYGIALAFDADNEITISWDNSSWSDYLDACVLEDAFGGMMINVDMLAATSVTLDNPAFNTLVLKVTPSASGLANQIQLDAKDDNVSVPSEFGLNPAYPNPFNPSTEIVYSVSERSLVELGSYDMLGRKISTLVSGYHDPNKYSVVWNGTNKNGIQVPAGVYFYRMSTESFSEVKKVILLK